LNDHCTAEESASFVLGSLEGPGQDLVRAHLRENCEICSGELKAALQFWYVFAALTERTQDMKFPEPTPMLRDRVIAITRGSRSALVQHWLRIAAGVLIAAGAGSLSWNMGRYEIKRDISAVQARAEQQAAAADKLESENNALRNLLEAARNPGRDAAADALRNERERAAGLEKRLSQTTALLAAATRDKQEANGQYRMVLDAVIADKARKHLQLISLLRALTISVVQLRGPGGGSGVALIADDARLAFFPSNLPAAPAGRTYQLWLLREKTALSAGTFTGGQSEVMSNKLPLSGIKELAVTEEPAGGSAQPTGPKILTGVASITH